MTAQPGSPDESTRSITAPGRRQTPRRRSTWVRVRAAAVVAAAIAVAATTVIPAPAGATSSAYQRYLDVYCQWRQATYQVYQHYGWPTFFNDRPDADDDTATTDEDTSVTVDVLANDSDDDICDNPQLESLTQPANGTAVEDGAGAVTYSPAADFHGTDSFTYTVSDGNGKTDTATVTITVAAVNDAPDAVDDTRITDEDTSITVTVLNNDTDPEGDTLTITSFTDPTNGGSVVDNGDGTVSYTPDAESLGVGDELSDSFTYTVSDGNGGSDTATVSITVTGVNDAPDAVDDITTTDEDTAITVSVLNNDTDSEGDTLTVDTVTDPTNGGSVVDNGDGTLTYTPDAESLDDGEQLDDSFTYTVSDGNGGSDTATVTVTVTGVTDAPTFTKVRTMTGPNRFVYGLAFNPVQDRAYVATTFPGTHVVDTTTHTVSTSRSIMGRAVAVSPDGERIYLANGTNTVAVLDSSDLSTIAAVEVGTDVWAVTVSPDGDLVYAINVTSNDVSVIDAATNTVIETIPYGRDGEGGPISMTFSPDGSYAYLALLRRDILVLDPDTHDVIDRVSIGSRPAETVFSPDGSRAYVAQSWNDAVKIIDTATHTVIGHINVGDSPENIAISPDGRFLAVANYSSNDVWIIDVASRDVLEKISMGPNGSDHATDVAFSPDGKFIYMGVFNAAVQVYEVS